MGVDLGDLLAGDSAEKELLVRNTSAFDLVFSLAETETGHTNFGSLKCFDFIPREAHVAAGGEQKVVVTFSPDHCSSHYFQRLRLDVPNAAHTISFKVQGRCWDRGA